VVTYVIGEEFSLVLSWDAVHEIGLQCQLKNKSLKSFVANLLVVVSPFGAELFALLTVARVHH
jgi:hypothetical protein